MIISKKVITENGIGTVVKRESDGGFLVNRFLIHLENISEKEPWIQKMQKHLGGLYYHKTELELITDATEVVV